MPTPLANFGANLPEPRILAQRVRMHNSSRRPESRDGRRLSTSRVKSPPRPSFLHSVQPSGLAGSNVHAYGSQRTPLTPIASIFRDRISADISTPFHGGDFVFSVPTAQALEMLLLLISLLYAQYKISNGYEEELPLAVGLALLALCACLYFFFTNVSRVRTQQQDSDQRSPSQGPAQPESLQRRVRRRVLVHNAPRPFGRVFLTSMRNYRNIPDEGAMVALMIPPLVSCACLFSAANAKAKGLPWLAGWLIQQVDGSSVFHSNEMALDAIIRARRNLVELCSMCSVLLLVHFLASKANRFRKDHSGDPTSSQQSWLTESEIRRIWLYIGFTGVVTLGATIVKFALTNYPYPLLKYMTYKDVVVTSLFFQFALYVMVRLARQGFTVGELGLVAHGATVIFVEVINFAVIKVKSPESKNIRIYRSPTPLLIFQHALLPGSLLVGFLLSPLLYLSRHTASRRIRRRDPSDDRKWRRENALQRWFLALGFYALAALIIGGPIGLWTQWCLDHQNPWLWVLHWLLAGKRFWVRPLLLTYWSMLASISIWSWNRRLARVRRTRRLQASPLPGSSNTVASGTASEGESTSGPTAIASGVSTQSIRVMTQANEMAVELLEAADKRVPALSLNARRKFFHGLAVMMFLPGIAIDPAFTHLAFSVAFAFFTFAEYIRYFALYPFGAAVHVFLNDFLDHKDSGTAILSHFYLLTGCAGPLWLEGPSRLLLFTGVFSIGIGDAVASIAGKRMGKYRWVSGNPKTLEGSLSFVVSVVGSAWALWVLGIVENFSVTRYLAVASASAMLEALSMQNDNLTLPMYMWSLLVLVNV